MSAEGRAEVSFARRDAVPFSSRVEKNSGGYTAFFTVPLRSLIKDQGRPPAEYDLLNFFGLPRKDIPMPPSAVPVRPGDTLGVNVSVNAPQIKDGVHLKRKLWWQARTHSPFNDPHQWGRLRISQGGRRNGKG